MKNKILKTILTSACAISLFNSANAADQIRAAGSSTLYPFVTVAAEEFGYSSKFKTPIIESTGTGGGFKLFCSSLDDSSTDLANASRQIKQSEIEQCAKNGIKDIKEVKIGYDGIVLGNITTSKQYSLTKEHIFNALAKKIALEGKILKNPYQKWSDIDSSLPNVKIEVYGPPPSSGTRDAFVELVFKDYCSDLEEFKNKYPDKKQRKGACQLIREDGLFIEAGENDNLIVQKLKNNPSALGIFGFSFLDQNSASIQGSLIGDVEPTFENIASGDYPISRALYVYAKGEKFGRTEGLKQFLKELTSDNAIGEDGYLVEKGLIPLGQEELEKLRNTL